MRFSPGFAFILLFFLPLPPSAWADSDSGTPTLLPPILVEGSAADALFFDPVVPTTDGTIDKSSPSGSIVRELSGEIPVPITDYGYPGTLSQFRGLGRTVEDTNVEALGVPLNYPQGGGFDFSTFPQFFWSRYQFRLGPGGTAFDPRASTGALALTPWTADALHSKTDETRVTMMGGRYIGQVSVGAHYGDVAALVGGTFGFSQGPTGSISARLPSLGIIDWRVHFLATRIDAPVRGTITFPTPDDSQVSARIIPVLEGSADLGHGNFVKSSIFFDRSWLDYHDPDEGFSSYTRTDQLGIENAVILGDWKIGATAKQASLTGVSYYVPNETSSNLRVGPTFHLGSLTLDGFIAGDFVSGTGWEPEATAGVRDDLSDIFAVYARESYAYRFPTLVDRYTSFPGFSLANPSLSPEQALTTVAGAEFHTREIQATLEGQAQFRNNAQLYVSNPSTFIGQTVNSGHAYELSLIPKLDWKILPYFDLSQSVRFSSSRVASFNQTIPYDPSFTYLLEARGHAAGEHPVWAVSLGFRGVTGSTADYFADTIPGYGLWDLNAQYSLFGRGVGEPGDLALQGQIENLTDRRVQVVSGYPLPGILAAIGLIGVI